MAAYLRGRLCVAARRAAHAFGTEVLQPMKRFPLRFRKTERPFELEEARFLFAIPIVAPEMKNAAARTVACVVEEEDRYSSSAVNDIATIVAACARLRDTWRYYGTDRNAPDRNATNVDRGGLGICIRHSAQSGGIGAIGNHGLLLLRIDSVEQTEQISSEM